MKTYTKEELKVILDNHKKWLRGETGGARADLSRADLSWANLYEANLYEANLYGANLYGANLSRADLSRADLSRADLSWANLYEANLYGADLSWANLSGADLSDLTKAQLSILPSEGDIIGWKKCKNDVIVKLLIKDGVKRSNATNRKCRAERATVLEVFGAGVGVSSHDGVTKYVAGKEVVCDKWGEDRFVECAGGIHFFITRVEAENY